MNDQKTTPEQKPKKKGISKGLGCLIIFFIFAIIGIVAMITGEDKTTNTAIINTQTITNLDNKPEVTLAQYEVIPNEIQGTTRKITVIVKPDITKDQVIAINDKLIKDYSSGLTHLNIDYFDDEEIAANYTQRILDLNEQGKEKEADDLFKHYLANYTMNNSSGYNKLEYNESNDWVVIKTY